MKILITDKLEAPNIYCSDKCTPTFIKNDIISVTSDQKTVNIWEPNSVHDMRTSLVAHKQKICAFSVSPKTQNFICTCSDDKIVLWKIKSSSETDNFEKGSTSPVGVTFASDSGYIEFCTFSWNDEWLALCRENEILIIKIKWCEDDSDFDVEHYTTLETSSSSGNICAFSPLNCEVIVTTENSSYFKVWNFHSMTLLYKSPKLGIYTIIHCTFANDPPYLLLGTNGAIVHIYNFKNDVPKCLMNVNVSKSFLSCGDHLKNSEADSSVKKIYSQESVDLNIDSGEIGCIIFGIYIFKREVQSLNNQGQNIFENSHISKFLTITDETLKSILYPTAIIAVCCNLGIALFNSNSWECEAILKTSDMLSPLNLPPNSFPLLNFLVIGGDSFENFSCMLRMSLRDSKIHILKLVVVEDKLPEVEKISEDSGRSVIPLQPVLKSSPLRYQMNMTSNVQASPYGSKDIKKKSSGYGKTTKTQMFLPVINKTRNKNQNKNTTSIRNPLKSSKSLLECITGKSSISTSGPPIKPGSKFCIWDTSGTEVQLAVTGDGENLACSSTASYICIIKFTDMNPEKGLNLVGHDGPINSIHFSFNSQWLVSSSYDSSAKVWNWRHKKCILSINNGILVKKGPNSGRKEGNKNMISKAQFYYMDQFLLTSGQDNLELFSHLLHDTDGEQLHDNLTKTKRVCKISVPAQQITCFSAANQFHSYTVFCCCSDHSVQVYDMNAQKYVTQIQNIHSRPAHHVKQMEGSPALSHPPGMYNLFLTTAVCDCTKLWDLRSGRCVQKYCQHLNRAYSSGIDISPCGFYVAAGSEDKHVYLYDTRKCGDYIHKLGGLSDVVMDVSFNLRKPILAAASLNGYITSYSSE